MKNAQRDGRNFALLLKSLQGGLHTFEITFQALEEHYKPFLNEDFKQAFREALNND